MAARFLEGLGYRVLERNYRCRQGEIDLVAEKDGYLVFVEVKTRKAGAMVDPEWAVTEVKQERLRMAGEHYRMHKDTEALQPRFDVIAIRMGRSREDDRIEHYANAF